MRFPSPALAATLRALHGEPDVHVIAPAFSNRQFARVLPFAPDVHPVVGALGALAGALPNGVPQHVLESPELSAAVASSIGTSAGDRILPTWAKIAPAGWGKPYAGALIDIANRGCCEPWVAAALIGPTNDAAALLRLARDIAVTIRRWGQATPNDPTAWMNTLSPEQQNRLLNALRHTPVAAASCLPWLPPEYAREVAGLVAQNDSALALGAYASASPIARDRHADILSALIHRTDMYDLGDLTHLAVATGMDAAWTTIGQILSESPGSAIHVVVMAPWDALREDVQTTILSAADNDPTSICAAIAFARGVSSDPPPIGEKTAVAFFSTVTPEVWNELPKEMKQEWIEYLCPTSAILAVRSIGHDPMLMAASTLNDDLIAAIRRHPDNDAAVTQTLLPAVIRNLPAAAVPAVMTALPPPDSVTFIQIASGAQTIPPKLHDWLDAHPTPQERIAAITVLRAVARLEHDTPADRCAALAAAFDGWSPGAIAALLAALPKDARTTLLPNPDTLAQQLAHAGQQATLTRALKTLIDIPPSAALTAFYALDALAQAYGSFEQQDAGAGLATALRDHGDCFTAIVSALSPDVRAAVLPSPDDPQVGSALHAIAAVDPLIAHHLAHTLETGNPTAVLSVMAASPEKTQRIWQYLSHTLRRVAIGDPDMLGGTAATTLERANDLAQALRAWEVDSSLTYTT
jgi:hypothetical protein